MAKKYLDETGLETLWSKTKEYTNNKISDLTLGAIADLRDEANDLYNKIDDEISDREAGDSDTLASAKSYTDQKVKAVGAVTADDLNTLSKLQVNGTETITNTTYEQSQLRVYPYYESGGPTTYGNILSIVSSNGGGGQLALEWYGNDSTACVFYRSKRDISSTFADWRRLAFADELDSKATQSYASEQANNALSSAKSYADGVANNALSSAKSYTDSNAVSMSSYTSGARNIWFSKNSTYLNISKGTFTVSAKTTYTVTFPQNMNGYPVVVCQDQYGVADTTNSGYVASVSYSQFTFYNKSTTSRTIAYIALVI